MAYLGLSLVVLGAAIFALPFLAPKDERARAGLFGICILLTWRYLWWRFAATLPPFALRFDSLYAWGFTLVELVANLGWILGFITLSRVKDRGREAVANRVWLDRLPSPPRVHVLLTTYNEEEAILTRTIIGAMGIDFPGIRVWVLDDGGRPWLEALCRSKGVHYLARCDNVHAKAGNINHALQSLRDQLGPPEFIATFDAA